MSSCVLGPEVNLSDYFGPLVSVIVEDRGTCDITTVCVESDEPCLEDLLSQTFPTGVTVIVLENMVTARKGHHKKTGFRTVEQRLNLREIASATLSSHGLCLLGGENWVCVLPSLAEKLKDAIQEALSRLK